MGFDRNREPKSKEQTSSDKDLLDLNLENFLSDGDEELNDSVGTNEIKPKPVREREKVNSSAPNSKTIIIACVSLVVALVVVIIGISAKNSNSVKIENEKTTEVVSKDNVKVTEEETKAGIPNLSANTEKQNGSDIVSSDGLTKDLNGKEITSDYTIKSIKTVTEIVGYTKHRTILGKGLEFYWLDVVYKGEPYKIQVPLSIFKELIDDAGYAVVDAEVTTTQEDSDIVTYMSVRKDQKSYLDRVGKK